MMKIILFPECILSPENVIARFLEEAKNPDGLELSIRQDENSLSSLLGSEGAPIVVEVKGEELDEIAKITGEVKERMQEVDGVYDVVTSIEDGAPEVVISIDRTIAGINNLSVATVIEQLKQQLSGKEAGKMEYRGEMRDIVIKVPDISLGALGSLVIRSGTQEFLLDEIASITHGQAPKEILRRNQSRIGKIMANMDTGKSLDKVAAEVRLAVKDIDLPVNYSITVTGEEEKRQESMHSLLFALLLSVVLVYMVMASQFESLLHPFTILLTIPLAVVVAAMAAINLHPVFISKDVAWLTTLMGKLTGLFVVLTFSSPVATAEFSNSAGLLSAALSQHHLLGFEIAQLEFHHLY